jgi:hypothetical protein
MRGGGNGRVPLGRDGGTGGLEHPGTRLPGDDHRVVARPAVGHEDFPGPAQTGDQLTDLVRFIQRGKDHGQGERGRHQADLDRARATSTSAMATALRRAKTYM